MYFSHVTKEGWFSFKGWSENVLWTNSMWANTWRIGRIWQIKIEERGSYWQGTKANTYCTNLGKNRSLLWIFRMGSMRGSCGRSNCQGRLGPDCERKVLVEELKEAGGVGGGTEGFEIGKSILAAGFHAVGKEPWRVTSLSSYHNQTSHISNQDSICEGVWNVLIFPVTC